MVDAHHPALSTKAYCSYLHSTSFFVTQDSTKAIQEIVLQLVLCDSWFSKYIYCFEWIVKEVEDICEDLRVVQIKFVLRFFPLMTTVQFHIELHF